MLWVFASTMCNNAVTFYKKKISILSNGGGIFDKIIFSKISHLEKYIRKDACFFSFSFLAGGG
jgi:hypothetical protein